LIGFRHAFKPTFKYEALHMGLHHGNSRVIFEHGMRRGRVPGTHLCQRLGY
jgi:hypothetical protein